MPTPSPAKKTGIAERGACETNTSRQATSQEHQRLLHAEIAFCPGACYLLEKPAKTQLAILLRVRIHGLPRSGSYGNE
jgi:hypothetical protein